jgi:DNA-binding transcriptional LysR family regulator
MMGGDMLDPVLLRSFLAVVQTGGFTRAAASLHLTQSTVSQQVRRLEEQLGEETSAPLSSTVAAVMW